MPYGVYLPGRWKRQPQGPVAVDWGNPLAAGLGLVLNAATRVNHAAGAAATLSSASFSPGPGGVVMSAGSMTGQVARSFGTRQTILGLVQVNAWRTGGATVVDSGAAVLTFNVSVGANGSVSANCLNSSFQNVQVATATGIAEVGRIHVVAARLQNDTMDVFCGRSQSAPSSTFTPFSSSSATVSQKGWDEVQTLMAAAWNRVLSESEIYALNDNPWQLFRAPRPIIYSFPSATIPTLSSPTVINITTTGATPRVTVTFS